MDNRHHPGGAARMRIAKITATIIATLWLTPTAVAVAPPRPLNVLPPEAGEDDDAEEEDDEIEGWIVGKMQAMSLREKIGQMLMIDLKGQVLTPDLGAHLAAGAFGNVILFEQNLRDQIQTRALLQTLQDDAIVRTGVPLLTAVDQEGGSVNRLGTLTGDQTMRHGARVLGDVYGFKPKAGARIVRQVSSDIARQMKRLGFNMNLAPVLDLTDDKRSYIYGRSFGGNPQRVSRISMDFTRGMESGGVIATGKHFPNLSHTRVDSHRALPVLDRTIEQLESYEFVPFKALRQRLGAIMVGHVVVPAIDPVYPASISPKVIAALRGSVGFDGVIVSDDIKMKALSAHYSVSEIVLRAVFADVDLLIVAWTPEKQLEAARVLERAAKRGKLSMARIDRSVRRILELKYRYAR